MTVINSRAFGAPFRYIQGPGELGNLELYARDYGGSLFVLIDPFLYEGLQADFKAVFAHSPGALHLERFGGECSDAEVRRVGELVRASGARIVAGAGGGKTLDTAKIVGNELGLHQFIIPTSASTDAPTSSMSVLYRDSGEHLRCVVHKRGPDLVLVDSRLIVRAPVRLFVAGMGDALSTWFEARANAESDTANYVGRGYRRCRAGLAIARACYETLLADGVQAREAVEKGLLNEAVENIIEANILLSGLGFENTGCAGAHAVHTGFHEIPAAKGAYHGEIVAFGVLFQLVLENRPSAEINEALDFIKRVGLPATMRELGVEPSPENLDIIAARILDGNSGVTAEPFPVTYESVRKALIGADALAGGRAGA